MTVIQDPSGTGVETPFSALLCNGFLFGGKLGTNVDLHKYNYKKLVAYLMEIPEIDNKGINIKRRMT